MGVCKIRSSNPNRISKIRASDTGTPEFDLEEISAAKIRPI